MTCIPKQNKNAKRSSFALLIGALIVWMISSLEIPGRSIIQLAAVVLAVVGLQLLVRYVLSEYRYVLEDDDDGSADFIIYKKQGSRDAKVCHVSLSNTIAVFRLSDKPEYQSEYGRTSNRFNYCQNMEKSDVCVLIFRDGEKLIEVRFEPDEAFVAALGQRLAAPCDPGASETGGFTM